jgi:uncharacterized membrane protein YphA (DoxX/SURF4 family)
MIETGPQEPHGSELDGDPAALSASRAADATPRRQRSSVLGIVSLVLGALLAFGVAIWFAAGVLLWVS